MRDDRTNWTRKFLVIMTIKFCQFMHEISRNFIGMLGGIFVPAYHRIKLHLEHWEWWKETLRLHDCYGNGQNATMINIVLREYHYKPFPPTIVLWLPAYINDISYSAIEHVIIMGTCSEEIYTMQQNPIGMSNHILCWTFAINPS